MTDLNADDVACVRASFEHQLVMMLLGARMTEVKGPVSRKLLRGLMVG